MRLATTKARMPGIPRLKTFSATFDNPARFPLIISEWAEGSQLRWAESYPPVPQRDRVLRSVARIVLGLLQI